MPSNSNRHAPTPSAAPPTPKATAKYTNKDGTKYISVPLSSNSTPPAQPSPTTTSSSRGGAPTQLSAPAEAPPVATVNKKKQKRRAKDAAKAAARAATEKEQASANGLPSPASTASAPPQVPAASSWNHRNGSQGLPSVEPLQPHDPRYNDEDWGEETESDDEHRDGFSHGSSHPPANGSAPKAKKGKKKKKVKKDTASEPDNARPSGISREKIWNTSGPEERERIKQFWLGLGEDERKSLVKVEKDAVLRKMKEQQKHTCSCSVCGRKRTAIEEELEGLYDAYYQELETFANRPHSHPSAAPMFAQDRLDAPKRFGTMAGLHPPNAIPPRHPNTHVPSRGRIVEHVDNEEDDLDGGEEEYSDEEDLEDEEEEDEPAEIPRDDYSTDFFNFGASLTVKGGILTVADDLLKNDGKKFIEMMEQLAERRMAREEDAHYTGGYSHTVNGGLGNPHNHPPPEEDEYDEEEEEDEEYESQEEDYEEEEDQMDESSRMEEGRRMFQIFAARMFEQRVLTAYREKVAKERQEKLLEELEQEETQESQRKAKRAKDAQKRKEKALQRKQAVLEEKAKRDAEKAAEEEARLAEETRRVEEARAKAEEKRKKKEAQKKAEEDERLRREAEKQRRAHEQKEKQAEQERKAREAKDREKRLKEEQRRKEQEAREVKERETRERREKHEKDKREKDLRAAQAKAEREAKEKIKYEEKMTAKPASHTVPIPIQPAKKPHPVSVPALPQQPGAVNASPQVAVATPVLPFTHTPIKPRSISQEVTRSVSQASYSGSGPSQAASPHATSPPHVSPGLIAPPSKTGPGPLLPPMSPHHGALKSPSGPPPGHYDMNMPPMPMPQGMSPMGHGFPRMHDPMFPQMGGQFRPPGMPVPPPGLGGHIGSRGFHVPPPGFAQPTVDPHLSGLHHNFSSPDDTPGRPLSHSRQGSASYEATGSSAQPIGKPTPIGRPGSIVQSQRNANVSTENDDSNDHLGSSALLDDSDEPLIDNFDTSRRGNVAPGMRPFPNPSLMNPSFGSPPTHWGAPGMFPPPPGFPHATGNTGWPSNMTFGGPPAMGRPSQPRPLVVRQLLVTACKDLDDYAADDSGYIELSSIQGHVDTIKPLPLDPILEEEILEICETEGNSQNGGGSFDVRRTSNGKVAIRFDLSGDSVSGPFSRNVGAPGEIGSPIVGAGAPFRG
ncbi:salt tolerance down-regulator-domain-containing protein [Xylariaceae sp. FL1272]|nr:salt tolerance down-regulator-domain-containing protein [Xylariaceae sp. FL1272]